jgi:hypothetical protein
LFGSNGVQLQYDTAGELYAGNGTNKYLQYSSGEVEIKANNFSLTTANGLQLSGSVTASELLVGNVDSNNYLQYNNNNFNAKFENFSASGDSVYISSSNFLLNNGIITANGGEIAGWTINSDYIRDNNNTFYLDSNSSSLYIINKSENKIIDVGSGSLTNLEFLSITNLINNGTFSSPIGTN